MAIKATIAQWFNADMGGAVSFYLSNTNGNAAIVLPSGGAAFVPGKPRAGYVRVKSNIIGTNANIKVGTVQVTDGTNTTNIYDGDPAATSNGLFYDRSYFFWLDWQITNVTIANIVVGNNNCTFDCEVVGLN